MAHEGFTPYHRTLGRIAAWTAFIVNGIYAVASGLGFSSLESPKDAIRDPFLSAMALLLVLMMPFMVVAMVAVNAYAPSALKAFGSAALVFMILLAGTTSMINVTLLIASRQSGSEPPWLSLFLPYRWPSVAYALDIFAWDWFFALSMLFAAPIFRDGILEKALRALMLASGSISLLGLAWLLISPTEATIIGIVGWGVAGPIVFLLLAKVFGRAQPIPT